MRSALDQLSRDAPLTPNSENRVTTEAQKTVLPLVDQQRVCGVVVFYRANQVINQTRGSRRGDEEPETKVRKGVHEDNESDD
jgi:hypothetical protein